MGHGYGKASPKNNARSLAVGAWPHLNSEKRLWVAHLCGFLHLRPIPLHSRDERWGRSPLLFSNFHFLFSKLESFRRVAAPQFRKTPWVPHPCGFQGAGFDFAFGELETDGKR